MVETPPLIAFICLENVNLVKKLIDETLKYSVNLCKNFMKHSDLGNSFETRKSV